MHPVITSHLGIAQAITILLHPYAEVVLHDLKSKKIAAIFNPFSKRSVGDDSLLEDELDQKELPDHFPPYFKTKWDGTRLKSTTATLRDARGRPVALFCINLALSALDQCHEHLSQFLSLPSLGALPRELFQDDWRERINRYVQEYLKSQYLSLSALSRAQKQELVLKLHQEGAFAAKHAAEYVGSVLDISRATVYKYLQNQE